MQNIEAGSLLWCFDLAMKKNTLLKKYLDKKVCFYTGHVVFDL